MMWPLELRPARQDTRTRAEAQSRRPAPTPAVPARPITLARRLGTRVPKWPARVFGAPGPTFIGTDPRIGARLLSLALGKWPELDGTYLRKPARYLTPAYAAALCRCRSSRRRRQHYCQHQCQHRQTVRPPSHIIGPEHHQPNPYRASCCSTQCGISVAKDVVADASIIASIGGSGSRLIAFALTTSSVGTLLVGAPPAGRLPSERLLQNNRVGRALFSAPPPHELSAP